MGILLSIIQCLGGKSDVDEDNERPRANTHFPPRANTHFPHSNCLKSDYTRHQSDDTLGTSHQWRQMKYLTVSGPNLRLKPSLGDTSVNDVVKGSTVVTERNRQKNVIGHPEKINCRVAPVHASVNDEVKGSTVVIERNRHGNVMDRPKKIDCRVASVHATVNNEVKGSTIVIERNRQENVIGRPKKINCQVAPVHATVNDEVKGSTVVIEPIRQKNVIGCPEKINYRVAPVHAGVNDEVKCSTVVIERNRQENVIGRPEKINYRFAPVHPSVSDEVKGSTAVIERNRQENVIGRPKKINGRVAPVHAGVNDEVKGSTIVIKRNRQENVIGCPEKINCRVAPVHASVNDEVKGSTVVIKRNRHGNVIGRPEKINYWVAPVRTSVNDEVKDSTVVIERKRQENVIGRPEKINCQVAPPLLEGRWIKHYSSCHRILLVGEGDFSFSTCLAKAFGWASNMVATSLDSQAFLVQNYGNAMPNLVELSIRRCKVMHEVDVTQMANNAFLGGSKFDRIIFNFPFAGFFKNLSRDLQLRRHRRLVSLFLKNAKEMISEKGEIHISHKTNEFHIEWKIEAIANSHRLLLIDAVDFIVEDYPGYNTKCGFGGDNNFNCNPSKTYKIGLTS